MIHSQSAPSKASMSGQVTVSSTAGGVAPAGSRWPMGAPADGRERAAFPLGWLGATNVSALRGTSTAGVASFRVVPRQKEAVLLSLLVGVALVAGALVYVAVRYRQGRAVRWLLVGPLLITAAGLIWLWVIYLRYPLVQPIGVFSSS